MRLGRVKGFMSMTVMNAADLLGAVRGIEDVGDAEAHALIEALNLKGVRRNAIRDNEKRRPKRIRLRLEKTALEKAIAMLRRERDRVDAKALSEKKVNCCW